MFNSILLATDASECSMAAAAKAVDLAASTKAQLTVVYVSAPYFYLDKTEKADFHKRSEESANKAFEQIKATLEATKTAQDAAINAAYTQRETAINAALPTCKASIATGIATQITAAKAGLDAALVAINDLAATSAVTADEANLLRVFVLVNYTASVQSLKTLESLENQRCDRTQAAELAAAKAVQTNDLNVVATNYAKSLADAGAAYQTAVQVCHNQGSGS